MKYGNVLLLAALVQKAMAQITGSPQGFATGVTGGGNVTAVYPETNEELESYLTSTDPQVIVLTKTFNFIGSQGTTTEDGCAPFGTDDTSCQEALDTGSGCGDSATVSVTYDNAGVNPIYVGSDKTIVGQGDAGVIQGRGFYLTDVSNIIIQNIHITDLNPKYVWGGDAITMFGTDLVWIDHCQFSKTGRQFLTMGFSPNTRHTWSNNFFDGETPYSATCDGHHYWVLELTGTGDEISFLNNYVYFTSGRGPALSGTTLFHAVNSVWSDISGHAIEGDHSGRGVFEGCAFNNVPDIASNVTENKLFSASSANAGDCADYLGRACEPNLITGDSGTFSNADEDFFADFEGLTIAPAAMTADDALEAVPNAAGIGKI